MAEFSVVMPQFARLCDAYSKNGCEGCPVEREGFNCACERQGCSKTSAEELEHIIMSWAAEHSEPVYPTWENWLTSLGVQTYNELSNPIPADIAVKLGLEPKEG